MAKKKRQIIVKQQVNQLTFEDTVNEDRYTEEQKSFIKYEGGDSIILRACAGSGKTHSACERVKFLLRRGVPAERIIFFSFTKSACETLQERVCNKDVKITTIHSFCQSFLGKIGKYKPVSTFFNFIEWWKNEYKPGYNDSQDDKDAYYKTVSKMYDEHDYISSSISSYKLQKIDGIESKRVPDFWYDYKRFLKESRSRDFADMLIEVRELLKEDKYRNIFRNKYDHIFLDEFQDSSASQIYILLNALNSDDNRAMYYFIGDINQAIYMYSGGDALLSEEMLRAQKKVIDMKLSINFRSDVSIVINANKYSNLKAEAYSKDIGFVDDKMMITIDELKEVIEKPDEEIVVLVRTNAVIKDLEKRLLKLRVPIKYFNFITPQDCASFKKGDITEGLKKKFEQLKHVYSPQELIQFIEENQHHNKFITSIHKFKGKELSTCIIVNSIPMEILQKNKNFHKLTSAQLKKISFDINDEEDKESLNIHYVACTRAKHKMLFLVFLS